MQKNLRLAIICSSVFAFAALGETEESFSQTKKSVRQSFLEKVQAEYLASYDPIEGKVGPQKPQERTTKQKLREFFLGKKFKAPVVELSERHKCELQLKAAPLARQSDQQCIDFSSLRKLDFFCGGEERSENLVMRIGKHLESKNGACHMVSMLAQPITDTKMLTLRRDTIRALTKNKELIKNCARACSKIGRSEEAFLNFFLPNHPNAEAMKKCVYFGKPFDKILKSGNQSALALELRSHINNAVDVALFTPVALFTACYSYLHLMTGNSDLREHIDATGGFANVAARITAMMCDPRGPAQHAEALRENYEYNIPLHAGTWGDAFHEHLNNAAKNTESDTSFRPTPCNFLQLLCLVSGYQTISNIKFRADIIKLLQGRLIGVANYLRGIKELYESTEDHPTFRKLPAFAQLKELVSPSGKHSSKFENLLGKLNSWSFFGNPSVFSLTGRILAAHALMEEVKGEFADALHAAGEFESYVAIAQLISEHTDLATQYCFVDFIDSAPVPTIAAHGLWNPFIQPQRVVTNDINFGDNGLRGMLLTGPNTSGKSTLVKGLMTNILLAQTFGVAAANQMAITPFSYFHCHLNIADDIVGGVSLLKAEMLRARELLTSLQTLPNGERAFVIINEAFAATSPDQAAKLSYDFTKKLINLSNCAFATVTHFRNVTNLANENKACRNYRMETVSGPNGRVDRYTYRLKEGISHVQNATQIAQETGVSGTITRDACTVEEEDSQEQNAA